MTLCDDSFMGVFLICIIKHSMLSNNAFLLVFDYLCYFLSDSRFKLGDVKDLKSYRNFNLLDRFKYTKVTEYK